MKLNGYSSEELFRDATWHTLLGGGEQSVELVDKALVHDRAGQVKSSNTFSDPCTSRTPVTRFVDLPSIGKIRKYFYSMLAMTGARAHVTEALLKILQPLDRLAHSYEILEKSRVSINRKWIQTLKGKLWYNTFSSLFYFIYLTSAPTQRNMQSKRSQRGRGLLSFNAKFVYYLLFYRIHGNPYLFFV